MSENTVPLFIVGCGRSGTQAMAQLFQDCGSVEMHHEYMIHHVQPLGVKYCHGLVGRAEVMTQLTEIFGGAVFYCQQPIWGDSSNKNSWFIGELAKLFPTAKFVHVVRDGRKVTSSLFNKLGDECLDDRSTAILLDYMSDQTGTIPCPPPEKRYWWPLAFGGGGELENYRSYDHYERIAYHWAQINQRIEATKSAVPEGNFRQVRLEDITTDRDELFSLIEFVGLEPDESYFTLMRRPHNVVRPENNPLSEQQLQVFWKHCADTMALYGYDKSDEYNVNYHP